MPFAEFTHLFKYAREAHAGPGATASNACGTFISCIALVLRAPSVPLCLHATFTLTFVFPNTQDPRYVNAAINAKKIALMCSVEGVKLIVLGAAAETLTGAASITSGLATLGAGSVASGGAGMLGGIVVVAAAPSLLAAHTLSTIVPARDHTTRRDVLAGGVVGAVGGGVGSVMAIGQMGAVAGFSASGITSGLAAFGGSMLAGVALTATVATGGAVAVGVIAWGISTNMSETRNEKARRLLIEFARKYGVDDELIR